VRTPNRIFRNTQANFLAQSERPAARVLQFVAEFSIAHVEARAASRVA